MSSSDDDPCKPPAGADGRSPRLRRPELRRELRRMAQDMADAMFELLEAQGYFDEAPPPTVEGVEMVPKRVRRRDEELRSAMDRIVEVLQERREPLPISAIAKALDVPPRTLSHPLARLVAEERILRTGARRGARYLVPPQPRGRRKKR